MNKGSAVDDQDTVTDGHIDFPPLHHIHLPVVYMGGCIKQQHRTYMLIHFGQQQRRSDDLHQLPGLVSY